MRRWLIIATLIVASGLLGALAIMRHIESTPQDWPAMEPPPVLDMTPEPPEGDNSLPAEPPPNADDHLAPPAVAPLVHLRLGESMLRSGWAAASYRRCQAVFTVRGPHRADAAICAGTASLRLNWPARAAFLAQRALDLRHDDPAALLLLADALVAQKDCRTARPVLLHLREVAPQYPGVGALMDRCSVDHPPDMHSALVGKVRYAC